MVDESPKTAPAAADDLHLLSDFPPSSYEEWRKLAEEQLKGAPFEKKLVTKTYEGIDLQPLYMQEDAAGLAHLGSMPGFPPYVRDNSLLGNVLEPWQICQEIPYSTVEDFNQAARYDLDRGQTALTLLPDQASLLGQDPDEAKPGDVGRGGVSIATVDDLAVAFQGINLEQVPLYIQSYAAAMPTTALFMAYVKRQGISPEKLRGGIEMDPLGLMVRVGELPRSVAGAYDVMTNMIRWAKTHAPNFHMVTIHGQPYSDGGASAVQELAFVLATAVEYLRELQARDLAIDDVAPRIRFSFTIGSNYFMEVAKLRAARVVWAKVVKAFGGNEVSQKIAIHARSSGWNKTIYDPYVNMLRATTEAFAGAVGGADSLHVSHFDEAIRQPDEFSRRIARNTQLILQAEAHLTRVTDPAGGSWYVENLTDAVGRGAWQLFQQVETIGGMYTALQQGFPQAQVAQTTEQRITNIGRRKDIFVGTNRYANLQEEPLPPREPDYESLQQRRVKYIGAYRTQFDTTDDIAVMDKLHQVLEARESNVLEAAIEAALTGATIGEVARTLRTGDEKHATIEPIPAYRGAQLFEKLRQASAVYQAKTGHPPQVFLANYGPIPRHKPRADFSTDFFQIGGFEVLGNDGFPTAAEAAQAALASNAPIVVICALDGDYPEIVPTITQPIKTASPETMVILAGYPPDQIEAHKEAGVDEFIHLRANAFEILANLQQRLGIGGAA
jgi:methylmalonyl-CoA mutase